MEPSTILSRQVDNFKINESLTVWIDTDHDSSRDSPIQIRNDPTLPIFNCITVVSDIIMKQFYI